METASLGRRQPDDKDDILAETSTGMRKRWEDRITRSTSPLQITPTSLKARSFDDNYDDQTLELPPEAAPAGERRLHNISEYGSEHPTGTELQADPKVVLESVDPSSHKLEAQMRRARLPYVKGQDLGVSKKGNTSLHTEAGQAQKLNQRLLRLDWLINEDAGTRTASLPLETNILNADSSLLWGHSEMKDLQLWQIPSLMRKLSPSTTDIEEYHLSRLISQIESRAWFEHALGGSVTPIALRYDTSNLRGKFLCFPYLTYEESNEMNSTTDPLVQAQTLWIVDRERDKNQCIKLLDEQALKRCISVPTEESFRQLGNRRIHVSPMWALISREDKLLTMAPLSEKALLGTSIGIQETPPRVERKQCSNIKISFEWRGRLENVLFPRSQCRSWFELLNKHRQILRNMQSGGKALEPRDFELYVQGLTLESRIWPAAQELNPGGTLEIRMRTPEWKTVLDPNSFSKVETQDRAVKGSAMPQTNLKSRRIDPTLMIKPFLKWIVLDEYGVREMGSAASRMDRFLWKIYEGLPAESSLEKDPASTKLLIWGSAPLEYKGKLFQEAYRLWQYFVSPDATASAPVQLFGGLLYELYRNWRPTDSDYLKIADLFSVINHLASRLHLGVYFREPKFEPDMPMGYANRDMISTSSILLNSIVDTLIAVYQMLISAVRAIRDGSEGEKDSMRSAVSYGNDAVRLLRIARDELIAEADNILHNATASVVPSPEGLLIIFMERLVRGVLDRGTVDVVRMYDICIEHLAQQIEKNPDYRTLEWVTRAQQELSIVEDVLLCQEQLLQSFQECLDPQSHPNHTVSCAMHFAFHKDSISKVLITVRNQRLYCTILRQKAESLAAKIVQLVQTRQADSARIGWGRRLGEAFHSLRKGSKRRQDLKILKSLEKADGLPSKPPRRLYYSESMMSFETDVAIGKAHSDDAPSASKRTGVVATFFETLHRESALNFQTAAFKLLLTNLPQKGELPKNVANSEDPGDGLVYSSADVEQARNFLNEFYQAWHQSQARLPCPPPPRLQECAKVCLILSGMRQEEGMFEALYHNQFKDSDLPLMLSQCHQLFGRGHPDWAETFVSEQYRVTPRPWKDGDHIDISVNEPLPLKYERRYRAGSFGMVDRVCNAFSGEFFALKQQTVLDTDSSASKNLEHLQMEAGLLRGLHHRHVIQLAKTYRRGDTFGMLLRPPAETNLEILLGLFRKDEHSPIYGCRDSEWLRPILLQSLGCLSCGLAYIHNVQVRHRDINPANVLFEDEGSNDLGVCRGRFLWADSGLGYKFDDLEESTNQNRNVYLRKYAPPESSGPSTRGKSADIFSLGCIFLEILAALFKEVVPLEEQPFSEALVRVSSWAKQTMEHNMRDITARLFPLAIHMIHGDPSRRPSMNDIQLYVSNTSKRNFCDPCWKELNPSRPVVGGRNLVSQAIDELLRESGLPKIITVTFLVYWDLRQYVQEELELDFDLKGFASVLEDVLTISGTIEKAYASSLRDYMSWKWPDSKLDILEHLKEVLQPTGKGPKIAGEAADFGPHVRLFALPNGKERDSTDATQIVITGDKDTLVCCAEQLVWLTAIFRTPVYNEVSYSVASFVKSHEQNNQYEIRPLPLRTVERVEENSGACWLPLFKNSIIACGFAIPDRGLEKGIELPYSLMNDQASILRLASYKGFSYLKGFSTLIYPTAVSDNLKSVQWHLMSSEDEGTKLDPVQAFSGSLDTHNNVIGQDTPFDKLASARRHFLGYCRHVVVHLATPETTTRAMLEKVRHSSADDESHRPGMSVDAVTVGISAHGYVSASATGKFIRPKGLTHAAKERDKRGFLGLCESARDTPLILYDESKDAGWLVPTLSAVLHMSHLWTRDKTDLLADVPAVEPCWNIGEAALTVIKEDSAPELRSELHEGKSTCLKDLVKEYLITLDELLECQENAAKEPKPTVRVESSKLYAWDLLDIVKDNRKSRRQLKLSEDWTRLCDKVLVLVGQGMGEVIRPAEGVSVCKAWSPIPPKHKYLTATVSCLQQMASRYGHDGLDPCFKLITDGYWVSSSEALFADCEGIKGTSVRGRPCKCVKQPQRITGTRSTGKSTTAPPDAGAVVFGTCKLQKEGNGGRDLNAGPRAPQKNGQVIQPNSSANGAAVAPIEGRKRILKIGKLELYSRRA